MNDTMILVVIAAVVLFAMMQKRRKPAVVETGETGAVVIQQGPLTIEQEMARLRASGDFMDHRQGDTPW